MGSSAFTVYIFHSVVLVSLTALMAGLSVHPLIKFVILLSVGTVVTFTLASGIRRLPLLRRVL